MTYFKAVYYSNTNKNRYVAAESKQEAAKIAVRVGGPGFKIISISKEEIKNI